MSKQKCPQTPLLFPRSGIMMNDFGTRFDKPSFEPAFHNKPNQVHASIGILIAPAFKQVFRIIKATIRDSPELRGCRPMAVKYGHRVLLTT